MRRIVEQTDLRRVIEATRRAQGLPPGVEDPAALARVAAAVTAAERREVA